MKLNVEEAKRLKNSLALVEKERDVEKEEKARIQQKAYDDVYKAHASGFNHSLYQVIFHCEVLDESIFDIDKDVYNKQLVLIDDSMEDGALIGEQQRTLP